MTVSDLPSCGWQRSISRPVVWWLPSISLLREDYSRSELAFTGLPKSTINRIYARAVQGVPNPNQRPLTIRDCYVEDARLWGAFNEVYRDDKKSNREGMPQLDREEKRAVLVLPKSSNQKDYNYQKVQSGGFSGLIATTRPSRLGSLD